MEADEDQYETLLIEHLLEQSPLIEGTKSLTLQQKEEMQRGIQCLEADYFDPLIGMLQRFIPEGEGDDEEVVLEVDQIDDPLQVKMYNYMVKAIRQQEDSRRVREGGVTGMDEVDVDQFYDALEVKMRKHLDGTIPQSQEVESKYLLLLWNLITNQCVLFFYNVHLTEMEQLLNQKQQIEENIDSVKEKILQSTELAKLLKHKVEGNKLIENWNVINTQLVSLKDDIKDELQRQIDAFQVPLAKCQKSMNTKKRSIERHRKAMEKLESELKQEQQQHSVIAEQIKVMKDNLLRFTQRHQPRGQLEEKYITLFMGDALEKLEKEYEKWSTDDVIAWIKIMGFDDERLEKSIRDANICGETLSHLNKSCLTMIGLPSSDIDKLSRYIERVSSKEQNANNKCTICVERTIDSVVIPCGHACFCKSCGDKNIISNCPICKVPIEKVLKTYMHGF